MLLQIIATTGWRYFPSRLFQGSAKKCNKFLILLSSAQVRGNKTSSTVNIFDSVDVQKYLKYVIKHDQCLPEGSEELNELIEKKISLEKDLKKLGEMSSEGDKELEKLIVTEKEEYLDSIGELKQKILMKIMPKLEDDDSRNVELKIIPGIGGEEAKCFSLELYNMYLQYAEYNNWEYSGTIDDGNILICGTHVFGQLKYEAGVHRVQRVPGNDTLRRIHTSTCSVLILPQPRPHEIKIAEKDITVEKIKSSGPGGQNVNKRETCIRVKHIPTGITVENQTSRYQYENLKEAINRLRGILFNIEREKLMSERKAARKEQIGTNDYSDKIRTYNFPQNRVTDHRINLSTQNLRGFLSGGKELENFIRHVREHSRNMEFMKNIRNVLESVEYKNFEKQQMNS